jgi:glutamine amidotransferase-like uncharacterized protein
MKKSIYAVFLAFCAGILFTGCRSTAVQTAAPEEKPQLNAALYVDNGSSGGGVFNWATLLDLSPEIRLHLILGKDVREGILDKMDLVIMPGGYPGRQFNSLGKDGVEALRKFIANGGGYVGSCAGLANTLNNNERLRLLPFRRRPNSGGNYATLMVEINEKGAKILNVKPEKILVRYAGGPIPMMGKKKVHDISTGEVLAVYKNTVSYFNKPEGNFFDQGAIIYGNYGKGKVIATGFHPENWNDTHAIALGCIYAVTGKKVTSEMPFKQRRPYRVGYYCNGKDNVSNIEAALRLNRHPQIDIKFFNDQNVREGELYHLDMIVFPDANPNICKAFVTKDFLRKELSGFAARGGKIFAAGRGVSALSDQSQALIVKGNEELTPELLIRNF